jgi:hypothetical protein
MLLSVGFGVVIAPGTVAEPGIVEPACVIALALLEWGEVLPSASKATTVYEYRVEAARLLSE